MTAAFPLSWPHGVARTKTREPGRFKATLSASLGNVQTSLRMFGGDSRKAVSNVVISSNVTLGANNPEDPGVAIYFTWDGLNVCVAVDRYSSVAANLQAIHHIVEARRTEIRHGTLAMVRATFQGFLALPAPNGSSWRVVLGFRPEDQPDAVEVDRQFRDRARAAHPDAGGSTAAMQILNAARAAALAEIGGKS